MLRQGVSMVHVLVAIGTGIASGLYIFGPYFKSRSAMEHITATAQQNLETDKHANTNAKDHNSVDVDHKTR